MSFVQDIRHSRRPLAGFLAIGSVWACYFAQMPVIKANVGASDGAYGSVVLLASLGALAAMWLAPLFRRLFGGEAVALGILITLAGVLWSGGVRDLWLLCLALTLMSVGSGIVDVLVNARVSEIEESTGRGLMNLNHALYSFAYSGAALLTGLLRESGLGPLTIFGLLGLVLLALAWSARDLPPEIEGPVGEGAPARLPLGFVVMAGLVVMAAFLSEASAEGWSALHLERTLGGTPAQGALGPATMGLMMGFGRIFGHLLARFMRGTVLMGLAMLLSGVGLLVAAFAETVWVGLAGFAVAGLGISVVAPLALALVGRTVRREHRLAAISRASVLGYGAFFVGPPLMGLVAEGYGLRVSFITVALLLVATALVLLPLLAGAASRTLAARA
ncbi:MAG: MFS transporter [Sulfitobacter sp.]|nr:MFS transporter [Sulfitobacter sp.]